MPNVAMSAANDLESLLRPMGLRACVYKSEFQYTTQFYFIFTKYETVKANNGTGVFYL